LDSSGAKWIFDGKPDASEIHTGVDYALGTGTPLVAVADGTVAVAEDLFFTGNAVFVNHGNGLVTMYFHLSEIKVQAGQDVKKGETLGLAGSTGRASGPHLHFGVRWHDARISPEALLDDPADIPALGANDPSPGGVATR
jgi:murein DD-endopeptidase MepM/ murein hydrolase activator NlpD